MKKPTPSHTIAVAAVVALVLSLCGLSYSAGKIDGANIANRSIPGKAIKKDAITSKEVKESTLPFAAKTVEAVHVVGAPGQVPFGTGWEFGGNVNEEVPGFWKDQGGVVHLQGAAGLFSGSGDVIFTLPPGYRPHLQQWFITYGAGAAPDYVYVDPNGTVHLFSGPSSYVGLGNITFRAAS